MTSPSRSFGVLPLHRARILDQRFELESGRPEIAIVKEQARLELDLAEPQRGIGERPARIDVEIRCARQRARSLPSAEVLPGRSEGQLAREIAQGRPRQAFNKGLTVVALRELRSNEQVAGSPESIFERHVPHDLDRFHAHARPSRGMAPDDLGRRNVDNRASFKIRTPPGRRAILGDQTCGRACKSGGVIYCRFGGAGHGSISLALMMPVQARTLLVGTIETRTLPLSRRVEARSSRSFEARVFAREFGRNREETARAN